jgi:carbonic anhydrase/acetyltransferase-like protein (isoleucine patch superfamily)
MIYSLGSRIPQIAPDAWVAHNATVVGSIHLHARSSVWFNCVLRGDNDDIIVGEDSNVQDSAVLHTDPGVKLTIGRGCTIGHQVMLHGCTIGDGTLIGIQSVVLDRAAIGSNCLLGAGSLVPPGKQYPDGVLLLGRPAAVVRELRPDELKLLKNAAAGYVRHAQIFRSQMRPLEP